MAGTSVVGESIRCSSCGGMNPASADWCGQCLQRFAAPSPPPPPPPPPPPAGVPAPMPAPAATEIPHAVTRGAFTVDGETITWRCETCDAVNPLSSHRCEVCAAPFSRIAREPEPERPARDPGTAALASVFFPGAGHAYMGDWGGAIARAVLSLWVAFVFLFSAFQRDVPGTLPIAITFGLSSLVLWLVSAHDAYRTASGHGQLVILRGRRFLFTTVGLLGVMMLLMVASAFSAQG